VHPLRAPAAPAARLASPRLAVWPRCPLLRRARHVSRRTLGRAVTLSQGPTASCTPSRSATSCRDRTRAPSSAGGLIACDMLLCVRVSVCVARRNRPRTVGPKLAGAGNMAVGGPRCATRPSGLLGREPLAVAASPSPLRERTPGGRAGGLRWSATRTRSRTCASQPAGLALGCAPAARAAACPRVPAAPRPLQLLYGDVVVPLVGLELVLQKGGQAGSRQVQVASGADEEPQPLRCAMPYLGVTVTLDFWARLHDFATLGLAPPGWSTVPILILSCAARFLILFVAVPPDAASMHV
jgi:hypothetical protein